MWFRCRWRLTTATRDGVKIRLKYRTYETALRAALEFEHPYYGGRIDGPFPEEINCLREDYSALPVREITWLEDNHGVLFELLDRAIRLGAKLDELEKQLDNQFLRDCAVMLDEAPMAYSMLVDFSSRRLVEREITSRSNRRVSSRLDSTSCLSG